MIFFIPHLVYSINICYLHGVGVPQTVLVAVVEILDRHQLGEGLEAHVMHVAMVTGPQGDTGDPWRSEERILGLRNCLRAPGPAPALETGPGLHGEVGSEVRITLIITWNLNHLFFLLANLHPD